MQIISKNVLTKVGQYINADKHRELRDNFIRENGAFIGTVPKPSYKVNWYTV